MDSSDTIGIPWKTEFNAGTCARMLTDDPVCNKLFDWLMNQQMIDKENCQMDNYTGLCSIN